MESTNPREHIAIVGSGASAIYLLKHLSDEPDFLRRHIAAISIFEKDDLTGMGMPYSPVTTDRYNMSNISSEELPELTVTFADWLREQEPEVLEELFLTGVEIRDDEVYNRIALGRYLHSQYQALIRKLTEAGVEIREHPGCEITDVTDHPTSGKVTLATRDGASHEFDKIMVATGHHWENTDNPDTGYYASPWPISKLLPADGEIMDYPIGTLGASLSAFDVISSIVHRQGRFEERDGLKIYHPRPGTENFKITMHAAGGLLPHLQFDQDEPFREIYRHVDRDGLLELRDWDGFIRLETYFQEVCKPALMTAFEKDGMPDMVALLGRPDFMLEDFVERMTDKHDYENAFEGMRFEMMEARRSVEEHKPIHWKEVIDDLMYTLNFHAEMMCAEDHVMLKSTVMPFLMNVIAAMPLPSAATLLALYDAGKLDMVTGRARISETQDEDGMTRVVVENDGEETRFSYGMFVDCSGQKPLELEDYPFQTLVRNGTVRKARATFLDPDAIDSLPEENKDRVFHDEGRWVYHVGGIDIDGGYRVIGRDGLANPRIFELAFPHTSGIRPYSYGLQACSHTGAIVVAAWIDRLGAGKDKGITEVYEEI